MDIDATNHFKAEIPMKKKTENRSPEKPIHSLDSLDTTASC
jgi:hypothetical protein